MGLPNRDIAYFVGLPDHFPKAYFAKKSSKNPAEAFISGSLLTYRLASQVYEAQDLGFTPAEIAELVDARIKTISFAIAQRISIERPIIDALREVYKDNKHDKPYV